MRGVAAALLDKRRATVQARKNGVSSWAALAARVAPELPASRTPAATVR